MTCLKNGSSSTWHMGRGGRVGPVRNVEVVSTGQGES